jgi:phenylalanyl-tRNA synthetase beta chain
MVYVYARLSKLNKYIGKDLTIDEIKETLSDMGMDTKGQTEESDPEIKIEITAEKVDMVSVVGIARAIKFYRGIETIISKYEIKKSGLKLIVKDTAHKSRPKTVAALLRDVPMTEEFLNEMIEIQEKIHDSFGRGRKKAAIGIYPMDEIEFPITYGAEDPKEILFQPLESDKDLNGHEILEHHDTGKKFAHLLKDFTLYPVFRDDRGKVLSMPPIINSADTGRVEAHHRDLFIECSGFNITHLDNVLKVIITTFIEMGCRAEYIDVEYPDGEKYALDLRSYEETTSISYINSLIGINVDKSMIKKLASKVMFNVKSIDSSGNILFDIPCYRCDIWHDSDIADDIARAYGYNNIVPTFPNVSSVGSHLPFSQFKERWSDALTKLGFIELYTYMLTSAEFQYKKMGLEEKESIRLIDSAEQGINMVRTMVLPEVLNSIRINRKHKYPQKVFENGMTIQVDDSVDVKARNITSLCVCIADSSADYTQIKGILDTLFTLEQVVFEIKESNHPFLITGRQANIIINGESIGFIGEMHPQILDSFDLKVPISVFEINLTALYELLVR